MIVIQRNHRLLNAALFWAAAALILPVRLAAQDDVHLKVRSRGFSRINLRVDSFSSDRKSEVPRLIQELIMRDLELSGFFTVFSVPGDDSGQVQTPAAAAVSGSVRLAGSRAALSVEISDQPSGQVIMTQDYQSSLSRIRALGHACADDIVLYLTGYQGISLTKIAFVAEKAESKEISVIDFDGSVSAQLTYNRSINLSPHWSPDGRQLAFTSFFSGNPDLVLYDLEKREYTNISRLNELHSAPCWSPDGKRLALSLTSGGNADICVINKNGSGLRQLTHSPAIDASPSWSPDGRQIVFTSGRSGSPQLYVMDADGGNVRRLSYEGRYNASPDWSPSGGSIAFVTRDAGGFQICTIDVNGENMQRLTGSSGSNENPAWSPNGMWLTFASSRSGQWDIYVMNRDGTGLRRLTTNGGNRSPCWSPLLKHDSF